ncbi:hypothetical protein ACLOJK_026007 [Asimina triloba]
MTSTICHGIQSLADPWLVEKRVLTLRLASPDPQVFPTVDSKEGHAEEEAPAKSCKDGLRNPPLPTRPRIRLSKRSLELCTENLGCETGTLDVFDESIPSSPSLTNSRSKPQLKKLEKTQPKKNDFPPPLTTMAGQDRIRLRPQREDGRLVLKAVAIPPPRTFFQSTRSDGRLRLQLLGNAEAPVKEAEQEERAEGEQVECLEGKAQESVLEEEQENEESTNRTNPDGFHGNEGKSKESGMEVENFQRPSRCKEGGTEDLMSWEPFWVAIS